MNGVSRQSRSMLSINHYAPVRHFIISSKILVGGFFFLINLSFVCYKFRAVKRLQSNLSQRLFSVVVVFIVPPLPLIKNGTGGILYSILTVRE